MTTTPEKSELNEYSLLSKYNESSNVSKKSLIKNIYKLFNKKYSKMPNNYTINIIENIIYNEKSHIVATFKDRLIIDDTGEFLKRYYKKKESDVRLPKFYEYYDLYSKIFPNYTIFYEGKYLYQNIQRKQRMIDLQEKLEMKVKKNEENDSSKAVSENKENVFNTDAIDSILNGTNNEGMEIIFNVNKNNINEDEEIFNKEINNIIEKINIFENKKNINVNNINNNNTNNNVNNNNINYNDINKDIMWNKKISVPINLNYSKNKRLRNSSLMSTINNTNITYYNNIQSIISKFFNASSHQKKNFLNLHNNTNKNNNKNISKSKYNPKKDKKLVEKMEQNLFKMRKISIGFQKNLSQNISTSNQTQKDISISKKNSSIYNKKPSSSTSSAHNQKNKIKRNINNSASYKMSGGNLIHTIIKNKNLEFKKKGSSPLTSRNPPAHKIGLNLYKNKIKNIKGSTYYVSDTTSRNNINLNKKAKSTIRGNIFSSISKIRENKNSNSKSKKVIINNDKSRFNESKYGKKIGYKEINFIKNGIKNPRSNIREKLLYHGMNMNNSRNKNKIRNKNISQPKTIINNKSKNVSRNDSSLKMGVLDMKNHKENHVKGINISNFSKILSISNINSKNNFSKTHRNNFGQHNK